MLIKTEAGWQDFYKAVLKMLATLGIASTLQGGIDVLIDDMTKDELSFDEMAKEVLGYISDELTTF